MSDLSSIEKIKLEKLFGMESGYVLDFSNRTFQAFILENLRIDIYDKKYEYASGSKANRLRAFWNEESNFQVSKLLTNLLDYWKTKKQIGHLGSQEFSKDEQELFKECEKIVERIKHNIASENIDVIQSFTDEKDFSLLASSIIESIQKNEPEAALDRLHTFVVKFTRQLCDKHNIQYNKNTPLHSLFGSYVKLLVKTNKIESEMTERILKSSISIMDSFNKVRNNQSFAHDNPILNSSESLLIFHNVASSIRFIESIEKDDNDEVNNTSMSNWDDIPF